MSLVTNRNAALREYLQTQEVVDVVDQLCNALTGNKTVVPATMDLIRNAFPRALASWNSQLADIVLGTLKAERLGKRIDGWLFTTKSAEQSTHPLLATYHARSMHQMIQGDLESNHASSDALVVEIGTGAGIDTHALAAEGLNLTTFEIDPLTAWVAEGNFHRREARHITVVQQEWKSLELTGARGVWADPSRRTDGGQRIRRSTAYVPSLPHVLECRDHRGVEAIGIKVGPADVVDLDSAASEIHREYIGYANECRELVLWSHAHAVSSSVTATIIDGDGVGHSMSGRRTAPADVEQAHQRTTNVHRSSLEGAVLIEPHPTVIAAGLVDVAFGDVAATAIDKHIAYGTTVHEPPTSLFYERFRILEAHEGIREKTLRGRLRELGWSTATEFKKRGWPGEPEILRKAMNMCSAGPDVPFGVVIVARVATGHVTLLCKRIR